jgi:two-component system OmpR family response regulator
MLVTRQPGLSPRVLVVDDDPGMRSMVGQYLGEHGFQVDLADGHADMTRLMAACEPGVVILDLKLGDTDGLDILRELRAGSDLPIMIVTGHRSDEIDRVVGLELGADDYITKPFSLRELLARIRVILRRAEATRVAVQNEAARAVQPQAAGGGPRSFRFGGWVLDRRTRQLCDPQGKAVTLTNGEHTLLVAFLNAPLRPLSREHLLQATRVHEDVFDRSIDVQILRLRRKLDTDPSRPSMITTERSVGYVFSLPVEQA